MWGTIPQIIFIVLPMIVYYASLSWLAWRWERTNGEDAFHLVIAFAGGVLTLQQGLQFGLPVALSIILATFASWGIESIWSQGKIEKGTGFALIRVIVLATVALITFDWITSNQPVELPFNNLVYRHFIVGLSVLTLFYYKFEENSKYGQMLRLGKSNQWAFEYWANPLPVKPFSIVIVSLLCWSTVLVVPISITGILSTTILKDVAIAILIARVVLTRSLFTLVAICTTIAVLRFVAAFVIVSNLGPPVIEAMVFLALLLWIRKKSSRTRWEVLDVS